MKKLLLLLCLFLFSPAVTAQTIHQNPLKAAYASPAEWPLMSSQAHWLAPNASGMDGMPAHTHVEMWFPVEAELPTSLAPTLLTVRFQIVMFDTIGAVGQIWGPNVKSIVLDNPSLLRSNEGSLIYTQNMNGNPTGVVVYTGLVTFNITSTGHGWRRIRLSARTFYSNGDQTDNNLDLPLYSMADPSLPESDNNCDGCGLRYISNVSVVDTHSNSTNGAALWGSNIVEIRNEHLPAVGGSITPPSPWTVHINAYNYGPSPDPVGVRLTTATVEARYDPDFHHGIPGTTFATHTGQNDIQDGLTIDLANLVPEGLHKIMFFWQKPSAVGHILTSLLVFNETVGAGGTPPPPPTPCNAGDNNTGIIVVDGIAFIVKVTVDSSCHPSVTVQ